MNNIFKTAEGKIVIAQTPNAPLILWACTFVLQMFPLPDNIETLSTMVGFGALFTWAWLEIFQGVNTFRRLLGIAVMIGILISNVL